MELPELHNRWKTGQQYNVQYKGSFKLHSFIQAIDHVVYVHQQTGGKPGRWWRTPKRLQNGTALVNAGSPTAGSSTSTALAG